MLHYAAHEALLMNRIPLLCTQIANFTAAYYMACATLPLSASRDFLAEPKICSSELRGSWVYVVWDNPEVVELSDSMAMVNKTDYKQSGKTGIIICRGYDMRKN